MIDLANLPLDLAALLAVAAGLGWASGLLLRRRRGATETMRHVAIPFGPFLAIGAVVYLLLLFGRSLDEIVTHLPML